MSKTLNALLGLGMALSLSGVSSAFAYPGQNQVTMVPQGFRDDGNLYKMCSGRAREVQQGIQSNGYLAGSLYVNSQIRSITESPARQYCAPVCAPVTRCYDRGHGVQQCETYNECRESCSYIPAVYRNQCEITIASTNPRLGLASDAFQLSGNGSCADRLRDLKRSYQIVFSDESHDFGQCQASYAYTVQQ